MKEERHYMVVDENDNVIGIASDCYVEDKNSHAGLVSNIQAEKIMLSKDDFKKLQKNKDKFLNKSAQIARNNIKGS